MAKGFKYYPCSTERYQDPRVLRLCLGNRMGIAVYDYILACIYRDGTGGVLRWDESRGLNAAAYFGLKESQVGEIVTLCGAVGLFDKALLSRGVVTSADVQSQYAEMCRRSKRIPSPIPPEYCLIEPKPPKKNSEVLPKTTEEIEKTTEVLPKTRKKSDKVYKNIHTSNDDVYINTTIVATKPVTEWIEPCLSDTMWTDAIRANTRLSTGELMTPERLSTLMHSFANHCICTGSNDKTLKDFKAHFAAWLAKQPKESVPTPPARKMSVLPTPEQEAQKRALAAEALKVGKNYLKQ